MLRAQLLRVREVGAAVLRRRPHGGCAAEAAIAAHDAPGEAAVAHEREQQPPFGHGFELTGQLEPAQVPRPGVLLLCRQDQREVARLAVAAVRRGRCAGALPG